MTLSTPSQPCKNVAVNPKNPTFMAMLEQYCGRPRGAGTPMEALRVTKHCEGTPRNESLARFTSLYRSASAREQGGKSLGLGC